MTREEEWWLEQARREGTAPAPAPDDVALVDELLDAHSDYQHAPDGKLKDAQARYKTARTALLARLRQRDDVIEECRMCQPATAENPNENSYQRGRFDGIMEYGRAINALKGK